jgi:Na+/H+-dicarboxylate symporter
MSTKKCCCSPASSSTGRYFFLAVVCALIAGYANSPVLFSAANVVSEIFLSLLKLVSIPIIFLSVVSTASGMDSVQEIKHIGKKVIKYTIMTTLLAASVALILFLFIDPVGKFENVQAIAATEAAPENKVSYLTHLIQTIPSNVVQPFVKNNVIGVMFIAMILSLAILALPSSNRTVLNSFFSSLYAAVMKITTFIVQLMPIAVWAFITLFIRDLQGGLEFKSLALYLLCVVAANLLQAMIVLPMLLKARGISPVQVFRAVVPALSVAFFSKSSAAALPMAIKCSEENLKLSKKVASFTLPLCTTINMNACAAFILTTVLFVSMINGHTYSLTEMALWIVISTVAAIGNAGVPMGCFFLSTAILASMNVPLTILGVILPFYTLIDMLESAINVWSDVCVATVVDRDVKQESEQEIAVTPSVEVS